MVANQKTAPLRESTRIVIRRLAVADREEFVRLARSSREFLRPWVYLSDTLEKFDRYLRQLDETSSECILICARGSGRIVGMVSISDIIRGSQQRASIGYNAFTESARQGYIYEGLMLVLKFAFEDLGLHRIEADIQPENVASLELAKKIGFHLEGYSPGFSYINGAWRDHERWAISDDMTTAPRSFA